MVNTFNGDEITKIKELSKEFSNNQDFGKSVRSLMTNEFILGYPNDQDLGRELRKMFINQK